MKRRTFIKFGAAGFGVAGVAAYSNWPDQGVINPCLALPMPPELLNHELVQAAWEGINASRVWDCHAHLIGVGDGQGTWINPEMDSWAHPLQFAQKRFFLNAGCADADTGRTDGSYVDRLVALHSNGMRQAKSMLLAFDYAYDEKGRRMAAHSAFYAANEYAASIANKYPDRFEWIGSVHPYRLDALDALRWAKQHGARAVKWLPAAMGINPASPLCNSYYQVLRELDLPLLTHAGAERAVHGMAAEQFGNPLLFRGALDAGVRVIVAHCASMGESHDTDIGANGPKRNNFSLFMRMLAEPRFKNLLYGDISAITQANRAREALSTLISRQELHGRLLNGSDYPLPGVMPLFSLRQLTNLKLLDEKHMEILSALRRFNPLLFDLVLKRTLRVNGVGFLARVFETRDFFARMPRSPASP